MFLNTIKLRSGPSIDNETKQFKDQSYSELKSMHDESNLFEDPLFPTNSKSLYFSKMPPQGVRWMRPREVRPNAQFVIDGFGRCDMDQGYIGNCWFIAACVGLMQDEKLFAKVVPRDQNLTDDYAGIFHFRFWLYGEWVDVVVDDRLPFWPDGTLVFCSNKEQPDEFWSPLLEKAYAKLYGSYESLEAGQTYDALIDMTGGIQESFDLKKLSYAEKDNFWPILHQAFIKNSILSCSINADPRIREARLSNGLVRGHAFTITKIAEIETSHGPTQLIRVRNPWGNYVEWNGAWSDKSSEWDRISQDVKDELGFTRQPDGEFWMNFTDFMNNWEVIQICHLTLDSYSSELLERDNDTDLSWKCTTYQSAWVAGSTAGGSGQRDQAKYWTNPQFLINLVDVDKDDNENKATVIIALMQKDTRLRRLQTHDDSSEEYIQFRLFKVNDDSFIDEIKTTGIRLYASQLEKVGTSGPYINCREVTKRFRVDPGHYIVIPSTYDQDHDCEFMLRIFTEQPLETHTLEEHKEELDGSDTFFHDFEIDKFDRWVGNIGNSLNHHKQRIEKHVPEKVKRHVKEECNLM